MFDLNTVEKSFEASPIASLIIYPDSPDFTIAGANKAFFKMLKSVSEEIIGKSFFEAFPQDIHENGSKRKKVMKAVLEDVMLLKKPHKMKLQRYDNEKVNIAEPKCWNCNTYPILNDAGEVKYIILQTVDITGQITGEEKENIPASFFMDEQNENSFLDNYPDAVFTLDTQGNFLSANKVLVELAECSREELFRLSFIPFVAPEDFSRVFSYFLKAIQGRAQQFDTYAITAKGNRKFLKITALPVWLNEHVIAVRVIARDITHLKQAEEQVLLYHSRISSILESITDCFFAMDKQWKVTYWNKEAEYIMQTTREKIIGKILWEVFPDAVPLSFYDHYQRAMRENVVVHFDEFYPTLQLWLEVSAYPSEEGLSVYFKDVTGKRKAQEQIKQEKEKYQALFNLSPLPKWLFDVDTLQFLDVNEAAIKLYGYSREEFLSMTLFDIWLKEGAEQQAEFLEKISNEESFDLPQVRQVKKSGEAIRVHLRSNVVPFGDKKARLVLANDITEKLKAEEELTTSERRFKALVQDGSDLIAILDTEGNYKYASASTKTVLGIESDFLVGKKAADFIHEEDKQVVLSYFARLGKEKHLSIPPFRFKDASGRYRWVETIITDMTSEPAVEGIVANSRDVTNQIINKKKLKRSIQRYKIVSKATNDAIYEWNILKNEIRWTGAVEDIFGYDHKGIFDEEWWMEKMHPDDREKSLKALGCSIQEKKRRWQGIYRFRCADDTYKYVLDRGFLLYNNKGHVAGMIGSLEDITERVLYTEAIENQNKRFREIAWIQSHLVRKPLSRLLSITHLISDVGVDKQTLDYLLPHLDASARELDDIIMNIVKKTEKEIPKCSITCTSGSTKY